MIQAMNKIIKRILIFIGLLICVIGIILIIVWFSQFTVEDNCHDLGGSWVKNEKICKMDSEKNCKYFNETWGDRGYKCEIEK